MPTGVELTVLSTLTVMVLGPTFLHCGCRWPALFGAVNRRLAAQQHRLASQGLALHLPRAEHGWCSPSGCWLSAAGIRSRRRRAAAQLHPRGPEPADRARRPTVALALTGLQHGCLVALGDGRLVLTPEARREILCSIAPEDRPRLFHEPSADALSAAA